MRKILQRKISQRLIYGTSTVGLWYLFVRSLLHEKRLKVLYTKAIRRN